MRHGRTAQLERAWDVEPIRGMLSVPRGAGSRCSATVCEVRQPNPGKPDGNEPQDARCRYPPQDWGIPVAGPQLNRDNDGGQQQHGRQEHGARVIEPIQARPQLAAPILHGNEPQAVRKNPLVAVDSLHAT